MLREEEHFREKLLLGKSLVEMTDAEVQELLDLAAKRHGEISYAISLVADREPPCIAEFLLEIFLTSKRGQALIGDMRERFARECVESGRERAVRRYWAHTVRTLLPLARRAIGRAIKWGAFIDAFWHHWRG